MKNYYSVTLILFLVLTSCSNYRKLSESEIISNDYNKNYNTILEEEKNVVSVSQYNSRHSKLIYTDKKGFWNEVKWENNQYKKFTHKQFPKFKISDAEMENINDEIREINSNVKYLSDTAYIKIEFVNPEINRPIYYENGNVKNFKNEKFDSQYLKTIQKILEI